MVTFGLKIIWFCLPLSTETSTIARSYDANLVPLLMLWSKLGRIKQFFVAICTMQLVFVT
jgi:hypothetical protein